METRGSSAWLGIIIVGMAALGACEVVTDFDPDRLDDQRTVRPRPLPTADGSVAIRPDASLADGALIRPPERDASSTDDAQVEPVDAGDGGVALPDAAGIDAATADAELPREDAEVDPSEPDATVLVVES